MANNGSQAEDLLKGPLYGEYCFRRDYRCRWGLNKMTVFCLPSLRPPLEASVKSDDQIPRATCPRAFDRGGCYFCRAF